MQLVQLDLVDVLMSMGMALGLALVISYLYRYTHAGYSYSRSFNISLVGIALIVTMVMMTIADNVPLSLGLVGAVSVIRFRTAIKDPRDLSYIFLAIAVGIACSVSKYVIAVGGTLSICAVILMLHFIHFGRGAAADYTLTFCLESPEAVKDFQRAASNLFRKTTLRSSSQIDSETFEYVYTVSPQAGMPDDLVGSLRTHVPGISRISLIQPETFVDV